MKTPLTAAFVVAALCVLPWGAALYVFLRWDVPLAALYAGAVVVSATFARGVITVLRKEAQYNAVNELETSHEAAISAVRTRETTANASAKRVTQELAELREQHRVVQGALDRALATLEDLDSDFQQGSMLVPRLVDAIEIRGSLWEALLDIANYSHREGWIHHATAKNAVLVRGVQTYPLTGTVGVLPTTGAWPQRFTVRNSTRVLLRYEGALPPDAATYERVEVRGLRLTFGGEKEGGETMSVKVVPGFLPVAETGDEE